jgi:hypothetical protein
MDALPLWAIAFLLVVGALGAWLWRRAESAEARLLDVTGEHTEAEIIEVEREPERDFVVTYRFHPIDSSRVVVRSEIMGQSATPPAVGSRVKVAYDRANPNVCRIV